MGSPLRSYAVSGNRSRSAHAQLPCGREVYTVKAQDMNELIDRRETDLRQQIEAMLSAVSTAKEQLANLVITRATLATLLPQDAEPADGSAGPTPQPSTAEHNGHPRPAGGVRRPHRRRGGEPSASRPRVGVVSERILVLLASADRPLQAEDVAVALGYESPTRGQVEGTRSKLLALVDKGRVTRTGRGRYVIAPTRQEGGQSE
jgi:hypothetical protein